MSTLGDSRDAPSPALRRLNEPTGRVPGGPALTGKRRQLPKRGRPGPGYRLMFAAAYWLRMG